MKKLLFLLICFNCFASENIYQANQAYDQGAYEKAEQLYLKENSKSSAAYYNLGNIYYRQQQLGRAIYYFKKANDISPRDGDIKYNLNYLRKKTLDKIENKRDGLTNSISFDSFFSRAELLVFISIGALLFWVLSFIYLYKKNEYLLWVKRAVLILFVVSGVIAMKDWSFDLNEGVVINKKINVYSAIGRDNVVLFSLHEGAEFSYKQIVDNNWVQIAIADGKKGWIKKEHALLEEDL